VKCIICTKTPIARGRRVISHVVTTPCANVATGNTIKTFYYL